MPVAFIKYCSWCAAEFGIEDLLLSEPTSSLQKQKDPTGPPHLGYFLALFDKLCRVGGVAQAMTIRFDFSIITTHARQSQPNYIHLTITTQLYPFEGHNPNIFIWPLHPILHLVVGTSCMPKKKIPHKKKERNPKIKQMWQNQERISLFLFMVCVCLCFVQILKLFNIKKFQKILPF